MSEPVTATNCFQLWEVANDLYPSLIDIYTDTSASFADIDTEAEAYSFNRKAVTEKEPGEVCTPEQAESGMDFGGETALVDGGYGPVYSKYVQLRDEVGTLLSSTITNLTDTAEAINTAAWAYAETDGLNADDLKKKINAMYSDADHNQVDP